MRRFPPLLPSLRSLADSTQLKPTALAGQVLPTWTWRRDTKVGKLGQVSLSISGAAGKSMESWSSLWASWLLVLGWQTSLGALMENRSCISYGSDAVTEGLELLEGLILNDSRNGTIQCPHNQCCFGIWNLTQGQPQVKVQGCWMGDENICDSPTCEPQSAGGFLSCRCRSDLCNAHISYTGPGKRQAESWPGPSGTFWIVAACLALFFLVCLVFVGTVTPREVLLRFLDICIMGKECRTWVACWSLCVAAEMNLLCSLLVVPRYWKVPPMLSNAEATVELTKVNATGPEHKDKRKLLGQEPPDLQFLQVLHDGQFSRLWQGTFHQQPVAIKAFSPLCHHQFVSEWAVHSLPLMSHDNVVQLLAAGCGGPNEEQATTVVIALFLQGSLRNFLSQHVCSWDITIQLGSSLARGLAFLHGQQWKEGLHKPGVAHRDLSSLNVLVREDRTCVITDFGHAMTLPVCHEQFNDGSADIRKVSTALRNEVE
ncbi:hypothetical protein JD844_010865 [Phrynosoma platyrhinos]|uniref:receptor protein serine/threonine kinase n=1 Tax=Phrynosoma platyrhinos TaxID=52577 RepID=A0ABQ7THZ2_PHRPL|nr:hypothetical protein JD844_010865 [Phrynosoma platyrhinos]